MICSSLNHRFIPRSFTSERSRLTIHLVQFVGSRPAPVGTYVMSPIHTRSGGLGPEVASQEVRGGCFGGILDDRADDPAIRPPASAARPASIRSAPRACNSSWTREHYAWPDSGCGCPDLTGKPLVGLSPCRDATTLRGVVAGVLDTAWSPDRPPSRRQGTGSSSRCLLREGGRGFFESPALGARPSSLAGVSTVPPAPRS
jgi:hypothetical protein